jgi:lipoate-protein ligase A
MKKWLWIDSGFNSGAFNMALDEALFRKALEEPSERTPVLRVYGFHRPAITYGYSHRMPAHWAEDPFYESSRRITGGGIVFHGKDLTYSVVASVRDHESFRSLAGSYRAFHEAVREAFLRKGIRVEFTEPANASKAKDAGKFCFLAPVRHDLAFDGQKVAGAAQKRSAGLFLHQGSVNLRAFIGETCSYPALFHEMKSLFFEAFRDRFGAEFTAHSVLDEVPLQPAVLLE